MARLIDRLKGHKKTLQPLIDAAANDRLANTLIFAGPAGIGKHLAALALTQTLVCEKSKTGACGECGSCLRVEKGASEGLHQIAPDGAQIKIEQARDAIQFLNLRSLSRNRVIIIDQAQLLSPQAANALLKSLEEPPPGTYFILLTPMATSLLATIRSRAQLVRFRPLSKTDLREVLLENFKIEKPDVKIPPKIDDWLIDSANGSVEAAKRFLEAREDFDELESLAAHYLAHSFSVFPADEIAKLKDAMKDKTAQGYVVGLLQGLLRDGLRDRQGVASAGRNRWPELLDLLSQLPESKLQALAQSTLEVENDLHRNVDRGLILENFALRVRS